MTGALACALVCMCFSAAAGAAQSAKLGASLSPERLGHSTTIGFSLQIASTGGGVPSPVTGVDLLYPPGLGLAQSGLGVETCSEATLQIIGAGGCPPDSRMGFGSALSEIQFGPEIVIEPASVEIVRGPQQGGHLSLLFYAEGVYPVKAQTVFSGSLQPATAPFGRSIDISIPLVESLPGAPDVATARLHATIGPLHLTYYEQVNHRTVAYEPTGIVLPTRCPRGGFRFAAELGFADGSHASATTAVACPRAKAKRSGRRS